MKNARCLKAIAIVKSLKKKYPKARIALNFSTIMELLVATILSAQCTDKRVNIITKKLFKKYRKVADYAKANIKRFEDDIRTAGFFHNKAKNIIQTARILEKKFNCKIPNSMEELIALPGIARKTANIILYNAYGINEGIAVDTHVRRIAQRIGLSNNENPVKIEKDLVRLIPKKEWGHFSDLLIEQGRTVCVARKPRCAECSINKYCDYFNEIKN